MEGELIVVSLISTAGMILITQLLQLNWFKKENFKIQKYNIMGENRIKLKKLERDLGVKNVLPEVKEEVGPLSTITQLLPLLKNLDPDQLGALIDKFVGGSSEPVEEGALSFLDNIPPELLEKGLKAITEGSKKKTEATGSDYIVPP